MRLSLRERRTRDLVRFSVAGNPGRDDKGEGNRSIGSGRQTEAFSITLVDRRPMTSPVRSWAALSATEHRAPVMEIRKQADRGSRISVAKAESLGKFLLVFIKVDQVRVIFGILGVNPEYREMHRADDCDHAHHMPHTGL
jgi:hypothetical protein